MLIARTAARYATGNGLRRQTNACNSAMILLSDSVMLRRLQSTLRDF